MHQENNTKNVKKTDLVEYYVANASQELREMVFNQYLSHSLTIYCDGSSKGKLMAVACSYVQNAEIIIESEILHPPLECIGKNIYSELKSIVFGLNHFDKYVHSDCHKVTFFTDLNNINGLLTKEITFKKNIGLKEVQSELIQTFELRKEQYDIPITIEYLSLNQKRHNPFAKCSHNGAYNLIK